ncbi:APC family permease [Ensifer adhaerens]|uniref:APC family permease n=1 Tax=Ensifer adhaerens TaxID=106592 RepID=UPI001CBC7230|nr:APC family permease [Ensifer adhaerens]MBZ7924807.1 APC family permease [Ensifer adhaerens]UAX95971.1 APC family permease [Ensifer adhaerens]UAY04687.1 APC family permease [Ensifer adhaerens]UAY10118.1 APC family permease [Ensifer adhaerens]
MDDTSTSGRAEAQPIRLKRTLGLTSLLLFGLSYMGPIVVYPTYGVLATVSQDTIALSYLIALGAICFTALSYGYFAKRLPVAGSAYTYTRRSFGSYAGFMVGWALLLDYFFLPMVIALTGTVTLGAVFPDVPSWVWVVGFVALITALNILGIEMANRLNIILMVAQLAIGGLFILLCCHYVIGASGPAGLLSVEPFFKSGVPLSATMAGAAIAAYSFLGFDAVATLTEETIDPTRNVPRAILLTALIGGSIFVVSAYATQLAHPGLLFDQPESAAFEIAKKIGGDVFVGIFLTGLVISQTASGIAAQASVARLMYAMGRDGVLPTKVFSYLHPKFKTPTINVLISGAVSLLAVKLDIATSTSFINFGAFLAFTAVNLSVIRQFQLSGDKTTIGPIRGVLLPLLGAITMVWLLASLDKTAVAMGAAWFVLGLFYLTWLTDGFRRVPPEVTL